jgi:hypothetical protein
MSEPRYIYEIARDLAEAEDLERHDCGYLTRIAAEKALASPEIDNFYRNQLKVWKVLNRVRARSGQ